MGTENFLHFMPLPGLPGYAYLKGGEFIQIDNDIMPIDQAEQAKINHDRRVSMLEPIDEMPPIRFIDQKQCHRCQSITTSRCSACWTWYCSTACQKRDWKSHVFVCRVLNRPNSVDRLKLAIKKFRRGRKPDDDEDLHDALIYLFADDHICTTFGFNVCTNTVEVLHLVNLFETMLCRIRSGCIWMQKNIEEGCLMRAMKEFCQIERTVAKMAKKDEGASITWFLARCSKTTFSITSKEPEIYEIWLRAVETAIMDLDFINRFPDGPNFNESEWDVFHLCVEIQPCIWRVPDVYSPSWMDFGFCSCKSFAQRSQLAKQYLLLAKKATFDELVSAYKKSSLANLMRIHGIDISELEKQGVQFHKPLPGEDSGYRLMIGVELALSGRFCACFQMEESQDCNVSFDTHKDFECEVNFGFHGTNTWERWQLLNFYQHLSRLPDFDAQRMAEAKKKDELEEYLDGPVPNMMRKLHDEHRTHLIFPRLKYRMSIEVIGMPQLHFPYSCRIYNVAGPPGLSVCRPMTFMRR